MGCETAVDGCWKLARLTRLIWFDRHNRFDHHDFRVMAASTSTVWAFYGHL